MDMAGVAHCWESRLTVKLKAHFSANPLPAASLADLFLTFSWAVTLTLMDSNLLCAPSNLVRKSFYRSLILVFCSVNVTDFSINFVLRQCLRKPRPMPGRGGAHL